MSRRVNDRLERVPKVPTCACSRKKTLRVTERGKEKKRTHVLSPSCYQHHSGQRQSCRGGKDHREDQIERSPWFRVRDRRVQHGERTCWPQPHCSRRKCARAGDRGYPCIDHPARYRVHRRRLPRTWHLDDSTTRLSTRK